MSQKVWIENYQQKDSLSVLSEKKRFGCIISNIKHLLRKT